MRNLTFSSDDQRKQFKRSIITGFEGTNVDDPEVKQIRTLLSHGDIGGVIIFSHNIKSLCHIKEINQSFRDSSPSDVLICIDQEGGVVQRLNSRNGFKDFLCAKDIAKLDYNVARLHYTEMAELLEDAGFNFNFAPCVDLDSGSSIISGYGRSYSIDPEIVIRYSSIFIEEMLKHNIQCAIKHFPGHGAAGGDTHHKLIDITDISKQHKNMGLIPFVELSKLYPGKLSIMLSHLLDRNLDSQFPYSLSKNCISSLKRLCSGAKVISDDYHMGAILNNFNMDSVMEISRDLDINYRIFSNNPMASGGVYKRKTPFELFAD